MSALAFLSAMTLLAAGEDAKVIVIEDCEDAARAAGDRWPLAGYYRPHSPSVEYVFDKDRGSRVVEFKAKTRPFVRGPLNKKSFAAFIELKYAINVDELTRKLLKHRVVEAEGDNFRFPAEIMSIPDRYQMLAMLKKLPEKFTKDELTVTVAVWAQRHMLRQPRWSLKIDRAIQENDVVELTWAMRFDPKSWKSRSFVITLMIEGDISKKFKFYTKETHVIDMETQGEEPGYVKNGGRNRDVVFYWRQMDEWKKETGPIRRGSYYRCLMDSQMDAQKPVKGWYVFRFNLTEDMQRGKNLYSRDREGRPRIVADSLRKINSIDVDASDCRIDDIKLIITTKPAPSDRTPAD